MKSLFVFLFLLGTTIISAQTTDDLLKSSEKKKESTKEPVITFNHIKTINANTTELVGKGKMDFVVTHNFGDFAGSNGGVSNFFGLDN